MNPQRESGQRVVHREYEPNGVAVAVVRAVADVVDADPLSIDPLYDSVDVDAVAALVRRGGYDVSVSFSHHGVDVEVCGDGWVLVESQQDR